MDHTEAITIFNEIRSRPYGIAVKEGEACHNCFYKGVELLQKLSILGYAVRGRIGESYWDKDLIPANVLALIPEDIILTHFFTEIYMDGAWRALDPSFQTSLSNYGFTVGTWDNGQVCFPITKLYDQSVASKYLRHWSKPEIIKDYFNRGGAAWRALNDYFQSLVET